MTLKEIQEQIIRLIEERRTADDEQQKLINWELENLYDLKYILLGSTK